MRAVDIIIKKRDRQELSAAEINFFIDGFTRGAIEDYQAAAWAMAVLLNGMNARETTDLTLAMAASGDTLDLSAIPGVVVDKHSTGGVGDKTTLAVEPLAAACGLSVGKMSGRGLGFSGGTLDKMEAIPGFRVDLTTEAFLAQLQRIGLVLAGQSADLAPADGKLYALRDVTGTVQSIPLIASSVMSKKIAAGAQAILLDVKLGVGAFMQTEAEARQLAELMVSIAKLAGRRAMAILSDMNQPLGFAVGNALEVVEAIATLHGGGPADFRAHVLDVAGRMLYLGERAESVAAGVVQAQAALDSGAAWDKFRQLVAAQGGDLASVDDPSRLPRAPVIVAVAAPDSGWLAQVDARQIGEAAVALGAGRARKSDEIDLAVGFEAFGKVGQQVEAGQLLGRIHARSEAQVAAARAAFLAAHHLSPTPVAPLPHSYGVIEQRFV
jgi:pyrimidine-nucleoside phosphorylase